RSKLRRCICCIGTGARMELSRLRSNARAKGKSASRSSGSAPFAAEPARGPSRDGFLLLLLRARLSGSAQRIRHCKAELTKLSGSLYGHWCDSASSRQMKESTANLERAASLSPKDAWVLQNLADNYYANRNFETAEKIFDRAIEAAPQSL